MTESQTPCPDQLVQTKRHTAEFDGRQYDVYKLIAASESLPVQRFDLSDRSLLKDILKGRYWNDANGESIGPSDLLEAFEQNHRDWKTVCEIYPAWTEHVKKIMHSDTQFPILLHRRVIIDGMHRLTKAISEGTGSLPAKEFVEHLSEDAVAL